MVPLELSSEPDARTRDRVARLLSEAGPSTAATVAERLGLTTPAVRRHLDALVANGAASAHEPRPTGPRGRGRPARLYRLTTTGHTSLTAAYDDLAASALAFLAEHGGPEAVAAFANSRVAELEARYSAVVDAAGTDVVARTAALASALTADGFAASVHPGPGNHAELGIQLCQGHCPVQSVAAQFPALCDAEVASFGRLVGAPARRLSTLAHGEHVCTTHISTHVSISPPSAEGVAP